MVITASAGMRGKKPIQLKQIVDKGLAQAAKLGAEVSPMIQGCQLEGQGQSETGWPGCEAQVRCCGQQGHVIVWPVQKAAAGRVAI